MNQKSKSIAFCLISACILNAGVLQLSFKEKRSMIRDFTLLEKSLSGQYLDTYSEFGRKFLEHYAVASISSDPKIRKMYETVKSNVSETAFVNSTNALIASLPNNISSITEIAEYDSKLDTLRKLSDPRAKAVVQQKSQVISRAIEKIDISKLDEDTYGKIKQIAYKYGVTLSLTPEMKQLIDKQFASATASLNISEIREFAQKNPEYSSRDVESAVTRAKITDFELLMRSRISASSIKAFAANYPEDTHCIAQIKSKLEQYALTEPSLILEYRAVWGVNPSLELEVERSVFRKAVNGGLEDAILYVELFPDGKFSSYVSPLMNRRQASSAPTVPAPKGPFPLNEADMPIKRN